MKIAYWGILAVLIIAAFLIFKPRAPQNLNQAMPTPTPQAIEKFSIEYKGQKYFVNWIEVSDISKISLHPNFEQKQTAKVLKSEKECTSLVNAGFYTTDNKPVGLFIQNGGMLRDRNTNNLFNGILGITFADKAFIGTKYPVGSTKYAIQSGPILISDSKELALSIKNDENARRIVASLTPQGHIVFVVIYGPGAYQGPMLEDLPGVMKAIETKINISFSDAINLDGGSASAFITDGVSLEELSPVGSLFCISN